MKKQAARFWSWIQRHKVWSVAILIVLLGSTGIAVFWAVNMTPNLARFGPQPPMGQNCGSILHLSVPPKKPTRAEAYLQPTTCFWQAYHTCRAATISQTWAGVDAGATDTLTIEWRNNHCALYGQEDSWANAESTTTTFLCTRLSKVGDTLQVSACDGIAPFTLDPGPDLFNSYPCGEIDFTSTTAMPQQTPQQVEACFFAAYQQCLAEYMEYETMIVRSQMVRFFYIDAHCGIAYGRMANTQPVYTASCASLEMGVDGLHFSHCGTDGNIFVPSAPQSSAP